MGDVTPIGSCVPAQCTGTLTDRAETLYFVFCPAAMQFILEPQNALFNTPKSQIHLSRMVLSNVC